MQMFKALINSLPYEFENVVCIGDFPKSTVQAMLGVKARNKVLCNLNGNMEISGVTQLPFPVPIAQAFASSQHYLSANLKGFSSLKAPADIKQRLPGIIFDETPIKSQPLERLIESLSIEEGIANLAVLNLNGAELEYLVEDATLLDTFNCIVISCSSTNMFEGATQSYEHLLAHFKASDIAYSIFPAEVHPFSFVLVHRMPNWKENGKTLTNVKQQLEACEEQLAVALSSQQASEHQKFEAEALVKGKEQELQAEIEGLKEEVSAQASNIEALEAKCEKLTQDLQWSEEERNKAKEELNQQNQSARISNKLNLKLQVDLDDLRAKYAEKEQNERELSQLIEELYVKLKQASEFYYELEKKYTELTDEQRD